MNVFITTTCASADLHNNIHAECHAIYRALFNVKSLDYNTLGLKSFFFFFKGHIPFPWDLHVDVKDILLLPNPIFLMQEGMRTLLFWMCREESSM